MSRVRPQPFIWATWVSKLLAGDAQCVWAAWFKAHHIYDKLPRDFDFNGWTTEHNAMVLNEAARLQAEGWTVYREAQNKFLLEGRSGIVLAGQPDLVATREESALVLECKTGGPRGSDRVQVMIYMLSLPHARKPYSHLQLNGRVLYKGSHWDVPAADLNQPFKEHFRNVISVIGSPEVPPRVPSTRECSFCDIGSEDCEERVESDFEGRIEVDDLFY